MARKLGFLGNVSHSDDELNVLIEPYVCLDERNTSIEHIVHVLCFVPAIIMCCVRNYVVRTDVKTT